MPSRHIFIVAAEKSGDELAANLIKELRACGEITVSGIGGSAMAGQGVSSDFDISPLSILGFVEGLKSYPLILERVNSAAEMIMASGADGVVLVDSWGFMIRIAKRLKKLGYMGQIIKYVAPQVWAMREGRSKILARFVDHLLTIHSFDAPYFTRHGLPVHYVGNPVFDRDYDGGNEQALRREFGLKPKQPVLCVLFGSRLSEIQTLAKPFADAVQILKTQMPDLAMISPVSDTIATDVHAAAAEHRALNDVILLGEDRKLDCFAAANAALACSGTVTTQLASAGVPTIVAYRLNALTYAIAKHLFKPDYVSIVNIAADSPLMPEFIQHDCTGANLAEAVLPYLQSGAAAKSASDKLIAATQAMKAGRGTSGQGDSPNENAPSEAISSSRRAANAVYEILTSAP